MISREQVRKRLTEAGYSFNRLGERVEIYRQRGTGQRVNLPRRDLIDEKHVRIILSQAGLSAAQIDEFIRAAVKENMH